MSKNYVFLHSDDLEKYPYPASCPFNTTRAGLTRRRLASLGLLTGSNKTEAAADPADRALAATFHTAGYLDALEQANRGEFSVDMLHMGLGTGDCPIFKGVYDYGLLNAGATVTGARKIIAGEAAAVFNPSGGHHHAHADHAAGFCYVNDNVLALQTLVEAGLRPLYLDVDVHHGDGVQEAFYHRSDVMTISIHQSGRTLFPGTGFPADTGTGKGKGYAVNVPLPPGTYDDLYLRAVRQAVLPLIEAFSPDVFVMEIGVDGLAGDPLAGLMLTNNVYVDVIDMVRKFGKPILATGGGGYHIENTVRAWALVWCALCGDAPQPDIAAGMGGVMLDTTEWHGGLRDQPLTPDARHRAMVDAMVDDVIEEVKASVFGLHGL
ncbi:MAG: acetoin utilization protein AcuC [Phycisphaerae bacterium]|nr:acetoin utilization protein AcuC [Phycisphaerae bacterium]